MKTQLAFVTVFCLLLTAATAFAHHPFAGEFDWKKPVTLTGTVTKLDWTNPHSSLYMDVKDDSGKVTKWTLEMGNPKALIRSGWNQNLVKSGDHITVDAWLSKSRSGVANVKSVKLSDGRELAGGSSLLEIKNPKVTPANQ
jgi:hypothetical protein